EIPDPIPKEVLKKYNLPSLRTALSWIHNPPNKNKAEAARKRFSFEEIFFIQLARLHDRKEYQSAGGVRIETEQKNLEAFMNSLPFELTRSQKKAINDITLDLNKNKPMTRLLEGDVGSGKTA